jgi:hypothetical protein
LKASKTPLRDECEPVNGRVSINSLPAEALLVESTSKTGYFMQPRQRADAKHFSILDPEIQYF